MHWRHVLQLIFKEMRSLAADPVLMVLMLYMFSVAVYSVSNGVNYGVKDAAVAVIDEDRSVLSRELVAAIQPPYFRTPVTIDARQLDEVMDHSQYVFVLQIPPRFAEDLDSGRQPELSLQVDATAMTQAGNGTHYLASILARTINDHLQPDASDASTVDLVVRGAFNPNFDSRWFNAVMQVINSVTLLAIILTGAALIREQEHGTLEHLLVMPLTTVEVLLAKMIANAVVIVCVALLSLQLVVKGWLQVPIHGSLLLFALGAALYLLSATALGLLLATLTRSMGQFGLLVLPVNVILQLLSGGTTPLESMPRWLQYVMQCSPSTHFVAFAQSVLYRGATLPLIWPQLVIMGAAAALLFVMTLYRLRRTLGQ